MKKILTAIVITSTLAITSSALAEPAKSQKQAERATENRKAVFGLLASNMGPLGAMAKGRMPFNLQTVEKNALRINQLSHMIADYTRTDTSKFNVNTEALDAIWKNPKAYQKRVQAILDASANLMVVAKSGNEGAIKKAIGKVGMSCGGCHDDFKAD